MKYIHSNVSAISILTFYFDLHLAHMMLKYIKIENDVG